MTTTQIPAIDTKIWASVVKPGMIIDLPDGERVAVTESREGYSTFTFTDGVRTWTVDYAELVTVKGYFNP